MNTLIPECSLLPLLSFCNPTILCTIFNVYTLQRETSPNWPLYPEISFASHLSSHILHHRHSLSFKLLTCFPSVPRVYTYFNLPVTQYFLSVQQTTLLLQQFIPDLARSPFLYFHSPPGTCSTTEKCATEF